MNVNFGSLELNRTSVGHLGTGKIQGLEKETQAVDENGKSFEEYFLEAVNGMNSQQVKVSALQEQVITDPDSVDIHDVTTAMAKAQMSLSLAQNVIERLVKGWSDLSQNR